MEYRTMTKKLFKPTMKTYSVIVFETNAITLQVEAEDDIEAGRLLEENINKYEVLEEEIVDWQVEFVDEI